MKKIVYKLFLLVVFILRNLPKSFLRAFFRFIAFLGYLFAKNTNRIIETNLNFVFENSLSKDEIQEIVMNDERSIKQLGDRKPKNIIIVPGKIINIVG